MYLKRTYTLLLFLCLNFAVSAQELVSIDNYTVNIKGQAELTFQAEQGKYYILHAEHNSNFNWANQMLIGTDGSMVVSDVSGSYPVDKYSITAHEIANPDDYDGDGIDDITEFNSMPSNSPFNYAPAVSFTNGATSIPDAQTFMDLATVNNVPWAPFLDDQLYVKFGILDLNTSEPKVYFINSNTHVIHANFWNAIGASVLGDDGSGEIVFNPNVIQSGGVVGTYSFNFSFGDAYDFEKTQRVYELLAASMPFLQNNLNHFIGESSENTHNNNFANDFVGSRIDVLLESEVFADINYIPFHEAEGYGYFRHMNDLGETPGSRDIVLYDALPNSLPRVGGIITSVVQTPLSHVNLRAIQDNVPNAYIKNPLFIDSISTLLGSYIYYKVENESFEIREASLEEVNNWYETLRPTDPQYPVRDLSKQEILPLDNIEFEMSTAFGAKCSNVATMRTFGFPEGTIPDGFGIPFYFYDEFMKFNNFYAEAEVMIENPVFKTDINFRIERLQQFREAIKNAPMPGWMMDDLQSMHDDFPEGTNVRCRSSTNNEDLPGFSGAGLYTSKTQYVDEGHISKSIKQVYASMWNFRAFEERDFYRIDHFLAAMGVLCHPNYQDEKSNGVGISLDPIYGTEDVFYLNTQVGESLVTNPDPNSVPEELFLYEDPNQSGGFLVLQLSNLVGVGELVMDPEYLDLLRSYLSVIHNEFALLYDVEGIEGFAMDIEYKITAEDKLIIKQARPWVSFWADIKSDKDLGLERFISPEPNSDLSSSELVKVNVGNFGLNDMSDFELELFVDGLSIETLLIDDIIEPFSDKDFEFSSMLDFSSTGTYDVTCILSDEDDEYPRNDTLRYTFEKLPALEADITITETSALCDGVLAVSAKVTNLGFNTISALDIQVSVNGEVIGVEEINVDINSENEGSVLINIDEDLEENGNEIELILLSVNGLEDEYEDNNTASVISDLNLEIGTVTLVIKADNYPFETTWQLYDESANQVIASGGVNGVGEIFTEDICLNLNSCFTLTVFDSFGDGICCFYGEGYFQLFDEDGNEIIYNNGDFDYEASEAFCPNDEGCVISADVDINHVFDEDLGSIVISTNPLSNSYEYSINGGITFQDKGEFYGLEVGTYDVLVVGLNGNCTYEEEVSIESCLVLSADIESTNASALWVADGSIVFTPIVGTNPFMYSIDGGQSFSNNNEFYNLPVGSYNVVVRDTNMICEFEMTIVIDNDYVEEVMDSEIIINEINYNGSDAFDTGDWIELYNTSPESIDLSGWLMKDDDDEHIFFIPQGTLIEGNGFLILTRDQMRFSTEFPEVQSIVGDFDFGLSSEGDAVRLYDAENNLLDEVYYSPFEPWPLLANGEGYTLELLSPELDNSLPEHWAPVNLNGSPDQPNVMVNTKELTGEYFQLSSYPNPFSGHINLVLNLDAASEVNIRLYDQNGRLINNLHDGTLQAGEHLLQSNLAYLSGGVFYAKVFVGNYAPKTVKWIKL